MTLLQNLMLLLLGRLSIRGATLSIISLHILYEKAGNVWWWLSLVTVNILAGQDSKGKSLQALI
jgi:hypothetical protein